MSRCLGPLLPWNLANNQAVNVLCGVFPGDDDAPLGTVFATEPVQLQPLSPVRPTVVIPTEGHSGDGLHLPQHSPRLVLSPSLQNRAHLEPFRRVIRVGKGMTHVVLSRL